MSTPGHYKPSPLAEALLGWLLPDAGWQTPLGDFEEYYNEVAATLGERRARRWYWGQVLKLLPDRLYEKAFWGIVMLTNYLKTALRNLIKHKAYASINVLGLAIGMACCLMTLLYVRDELSYDRFHEKADQVYRVNATSQNPEGAFYRTSIPPPIAPALQAEYPEVEAVTRVVPMRRRLLRVGDEVYQEDRVYLADAPFFDVFTFVLRRGDPETALAVPGTVILTETTARRYFGDTDPLGQIINYENSIDLTVVGVVDDVPSNSHLQFDFLMTLETPGVAGDGWLENWNRSATMIYVLLRPDAPPEALEAKLPRFVDAYLNDTLDKHEVYTLSLHALTDIHLYPHRAPEQVWAAGNLKYVYIFSIIGLLMMFIACINYVNLATARAMGRAHEVGVRKVLGSHRSQLIGQFIGESSLLAGASLLAAVLLVALCLPAVNTLSGKAFSTAHLGEPVILLGLLGMWAFVGLAAGSYPAFYLSAFRPVVVIRGGFAGGSRGRTALRDGLVVVQFAAAMMLIVGTMVVSEQLAFMRHKDLGYDKEHIVVVPIRDQLAWQGAPALKEELLKISGVQAVSFSSGVPNAVGWHSTAHWEGADEDDALEINHIMVDFDFMELYGFGLVAGRGFSRDFPGDATAAYVLNEAAVQAIGWDDPIGKTFMMSDGEAPVIGVVKDFHFESLHQPIGPMAFHFGPQWYQMASLNITPENVPGTLKAVETLVQRFAPDRPFDYYFLDDTFDRLYRAEERFSRISAYFTALALFLACLGLLGLTAFVVERRTKEIGIRKVLGASVVSIVVLLSGQFVRLVVVAFVVATPLAYLSANRWLEDFAFRVDLSWGIFVMAGVLALAIACLTISYQSIRAALTNPVETLRYE